MAIVRGLYACCPWSWCCVLACFGSKKFFLKLDWLNNVKCFSSNGEKVFGSLEARWRALNFFTGIFLCFCLSLFFFCFLQGIGNSEKGQAAKVCTIV